MYRGCTEGVPPVQRIFKKRPPRPCKGLGCGGRVARGTATPRPERHSLRAVKVNVTLVRRAHRRLARRSLSLSVPRPLPLPPNLRSLASRLAALVRLHAVSPTHTRTYLHAHAIDRCSEHERALMNNVRGVDTRVRALYHINVLGDSVRHVAQLCGTTERTVRRWVQLFQEATIFEPRRPTGRPRKLSPDDVLVRALRARGRGAGEWRCACRSALLRTTNSVQLTPRAAPVSARDVAAWDGRTQPRSCARQYIRALLEERADWQIHEIREQLYVAMGTDVSESTLVRTLARMNASRKRVRYASELAAPPCTAGMRASVG